MHHARRSDGRMQRFACVRSGRQHARDAAIRLHQRCEAVRVGVANLHGPGCLMHSRQARRPWQGSRPTGCTYTKNSVAPTDAASAISAGADMRTPSRSKPRLPPLASAPRGTMFSPAVTLRPGCNVIASPVTVTCSSITTASAVGHGRAGHDLDGVPPCMASCQSTAHRRG